jgi:hypothetical protein
MFFYKVKTPYLGRFFMAKIARKIPAGFASHQACTLA